MKKLALFVVLSILTSASLQAKVWEVKMLNKGSEKVNGKFPKMVFEPALLFINKGDSVKFLPTTKGHSVQSMRGKNAAPKGAKKWKSKLNKEHVQAFTLEGVHGIECRPHYAMGMIGAIVVGNSSNIDTFAANKKIKGKAKKRLLPIIEKIKAKK